MNLALAPADAYALTMVAILAFALGSLVTMFFVITRNGRRNAELGLPDLPEEKEPSHKKPVPPARAEKPQAGWEKDADWWK